MKKTALTAAVTTLCLLSSQAMAQAQVPNDNWNFTVTPYLWLPSVKGDLNYGPPRSGGGSPNVTVDAEKVLDALDFAAMINGSARKGRWVIATDFIYLDMGGNKSGVRSVDLNPGSGPINVSTSSINAGANVDLKGKVWSFGGGYAVVQSPKVNIDVLAGFRYLGLETTTDWNLSATVTGSGPGGSAATFARSGSVSQKESIWTALIGSQGRFALGDSAWFANYYVDVGSGSSTFTWQGAAGLGYAFAWGDLVLDYRYLYYSQDGEDKLIDNLSFGGVSLGAKFKF